MSIGLILIDIQNDYFPSGRMELVGSEEAGRIAGELLRFFRDHELPVFHVQHLSTRPGATFFIPDTEGAQIHASVSRLATEPLIVKHFPNGFRETELLPLLRGTSIRKIVIAGMMTHMCVDATTRAAVDFGFECMVAKDACATLDLKFDGRTIAAADVHAAFLAALNGLYGKVLPAAGIMEEIGRLLKAV